MIHAMQRTDELNIRFLPINEQQILRKGFAEHEV
jgi:hypothetical protein